MACPYFEPAAPRFRNPGPDTAMLPLGDSWSGLCRAGNGPGCDPGDSALRRYCNMGYARGKCTHFPLTEGPDAVRFAITVDSGDMVQLRFAVERGHLPMGHGTMEFVRTSGALTPAPAGGVLAQQARAYITSYRRRKGEPGIG